MITVPTRAAAQPAEAGPEAPDQHWLLMAAATMQDLGRLTVEPFGSKSWPSNDPIEHPPGETQDKNIWKPEVLNPFKEPEDEHPLLGGGPRSEQVADRRIERDPRLPEELDLGHPREERKDWDKSWDKYTDINRRISRGGAVTEEEKLWFTRELGYVYDRLKAQTGKGLEPSWMKGAASWYEKYQNEIQHLPMSSGPSAHTDVSAASVMRDRRERQIKQSQEPPPEAPSPKAPEGKAPTGLRRPPSASPEGSTLAQSGRPSAYPSNDDVAYAKRYGFFQDLYEPWTSGKVKDVLKNWGHGSIHELTDPKNTERTAGDPISAEVFAKASLAANRIPIAALGFDPDKITIETNKNLTSSVAGVYHERHDRSWVLGGYASTAVHESIHRGLAILKKEYPDEVADFMKLIPTKGSLGLDQSEAITRYLMATQAGNPEPAEGGDRASPQIKAAVELFGKNAPNASAALEELTELAVRASTRRYRGRQRS